MRNLSIIMSISTFLFCAYTFYSPVQAGDSPSEITDTSHKRSFYPTKRLQELFETNVGLEKGIGIFSDLYKPNKMSMYWYPKRHYIRPDLGSIGELSKKFGPGQCIECHMEVNPGWVNDWKNSTHANPRKNEYFSKKTKKIEELIGREIKQVTCADCHGKSHEELRMPTADDVCKECHPQQVEEIASERAHGRPNHAQSEEVNSSTPSYIENFRRGYGILQVGCDQCHTGIIRCDGCHTRHLFSAAEARRPEACMSCHMGWDHPDFESYIGSKMGVIYHLEGGGWDWEKPLSEVIPGKDYRTPTCQYCHMYKGNDEWSLNVVTKAVWRMGIIPPKGIDYTSSLKDYPYGVKMPPMNKKLDIYSPQSKKKIETWIELCSRCHGPRYARTYRETLDDYMFKMWEVQDGAQKILDDLIKDNALYPMPEDRDIVPMGDILADRLGPHLLGEKVFKALKKSKGKLPVIGPSLGAYPEFFVGVNNPSMIERKYADLWFAYKLRGYKGVAHAQQDFAWWLGPSQVFARLAEIQSEANTLRRLKKLEKK